jgi:predicted acyl esterase
MKNKSIYSAMLATIILTVWPFALPAADTMSSTEKSLREGLEAIGITDALVEMSVKIHIPDRYRNNDLGQPELMPAVDLWGTLIRPAGDVKRPTILISTAYRRETCISMGYSLVRHGYNVLAIDNRGTGSAGGNWTAFDIIEHYDTAYVIDSWIPVQGWSDGKVGMIGASYMAIIQFMAGGLIDTDPATGEPIHLKALFPILPMSDPYRVIAVHGGMYEREFMIIWLTITNISSIVKPLIDTDDPGEAWDIWTSHIENISDTINWVMNPLHMNYCDWFKLKNASLYFPVKPKKGWRYDNGAAVEEGKRVLPAKLPVFMIGGWFDIFTLGESECYQYGLANHAPGDKAMVLGPWYHITGAMGLGLSALGDNELAARWFDWKIKGIDDPFMKEYPVLQYVMGAERWRAEKDWPLNKIKGRTLNKKLYLSGKRPSSIDIDWFSTLNAAGNYSLVENVSIADHQGTAPVLRHDPPVLHGRNSRSNARWSAGGQDFSYDMSLYQEGVDKDSESASEDERKDEIGALTFSTEPLEQDIEITGPLTLTFLAKTRFTRPLTQSVVDQCIALIKGALNLDEAMLLDIRTRRDVQWIVELNDVFPEGRAKNVTSGWLSAWHRPYDPENPTNTDPDYTPFNPYYYADTYDAQHPDFNPIEEGTVYRYVVELWPTSNVFRKGHRIRVSISNSDFPHLAPVLIPSENTIMLCNPDNPDDTADWARLDFTTTTATGEGVTWKWITGAKAGGSILGEFSAADDYLMNSSDAQSQGELSDEGSESDPASSDGGSSSSMCFIGISIL